MPTYFTPIVDSPNQAADADTFNDPMLELDAGIGIAYARGDDALSIATANNSELVAARSSYASLDARLDVIENITVVAGGNVVTTANGAASAGQKTVTVVSTTGFVAGASVEYLLNGTTLEYNTVDVVTDSTHLLLNNNIGTGGILSGGLVALISTGIPIAANAIPHGSTDLTLPQAMEYAAGGQFNVRAFGAVGNGSNDDTAAIQAAVNAAAVAGGTIFFPAGTYKTTKAGTTASGNRYAILMPSNVAVEGSGRFVSVVTASGVVNATESSHFAVFLVEGLTAPTAKSNISFSKLGIQGTNTTPVAYSYYQNRAIYVIGTYCTNITIDDVLAEQFYQSGIGIFTDTAGPIQIAKTISRKNGECGLNVNASNATLTGNICTGNVGAGMECAVTKSTITGNVCTDNRDGIAVGGFTSAGTEAAMLGWHNVVTGNVCNKNSRYGLSVGGGTWFSTISGNTCSMNGDIGIVLAEADAPTVNTRWNIVSGNTCISNGVTGSSSPIGIYVAATRNTVAGNLVTDAGISGYSQAFGINLQNAHYSNIVANHSYGNTNKNYTIAASTAVRFQADTWGGAGTAEIEATTSTFAQHGNAVSVADVAYTVVGWERLITCASFSAPHTITLPPVASAPPFQIITVKDQTGNAGTHNITIDPDGGEPIDGGSTLVINTNYGKASFYTNGYAWFTV